MGNFEIIYDDGKETSFADLLELSEQGVSVMRSPHAPLNAASVGLAALDFETVLYGDTYLGAAGSSKEEMRNNPMFIGDTRIADKPAVKTMSRFMQAELAGFTQQRLTDLHVEISRAAIEGDITTWHAFALAHNNLFADVVDLAIENGIGFTDSVDAQTGVWAPWRRSRVTVEEVLDVGISQSGFLAVSPLECKLACMFAAQSISSGKDRIYHLAGRDMLNYLPAKSAKITALITGLQKRGFLENLEVVIVPAAGTKVVAKKSDADLLNEMWKLSALRDSISKKQLKQLLQTKSLREAIQYDISVMDAENMGGEGIVLLEEAIKTPIAHVQHRLK